MATTFNEVHHRHFRVPKYLRGFFFASSAISCFLALATTIAYFQLPPKIPLFYSLAEPADFLTDKHWLFILPAFSTLITIVHLFILPSLREYQKVMNQLFGWLTVVIQLLCVVATLRIIMIVW